MTGGDGVDPSGDPYPYSAPALNERACARRGRAEYLCDADGDAEVGDTLVRGTHDVECDASFDGVWGAVSFFGIQAAR